MKNQIAKYTIKQLKEIFRQICAKRGLSFEKVCKETYGANGVCKMDLRTRSAWERIASLNWHHAVEMGIV